jgi:hypothetical protein
MRTTKVIRDKLERAAAAAGRSLAQEVELRLEQSFMLEGEINELRDKIAEEVKNALAAKLEKLLQENVERTRALERELTEKLEKMRELK